MTVIETIGNCQNEGKCIDPTGIFQCVLIFNYGCRPQKVTSWYHIRTVFTRVLVDPVYKSTPNF